MTRFDKVIPPGSEGKVYASVDIGHAKGPIHKAVDISTNDPNRPNANLVIKAMVKTLVDFTPDEQVRFTVTKGSLASQDITVSPDPSVKLLEPIVASDLISAKMIPAKGGKQTLTVSVQRSDVIGTHATEIKIPVQGPIKEVTLPVVVIVKGPIQVTPGIVSFVLKSHPEEVVVTQAVDIRQAADNSAALVESVAAGRKLKVLGAASGWYQVLTFEKNANASNTKSVPYRRVGWISSAAVKPSKMAGPPEAQQVSLQSAAGKKFQVLGLRSTLPEVKVEQKTSAPGSPAGYQLAVTLLQMNLNKKGSVRGEILVSTDNPDQPQLRIPVFVNVL